MLKLINGERSSWIDMYSSCARSSYGRICASYTCIVDSVKDSIDGRNITSKENMLHLLLLFLTSVSCLWTFRFTRTMKDYTMLWKYRNKMSGQEPVDHEIWNGEMYSCWCIIVSWWTRRVWKFLCFLSFSFGFVYLCIGVKKVCLSIFRRVVINHQAADEALILTLTQILFLKFVCYIKFVLLDCFIFSQKKLKTNSFACCLLTLCPKDRSVQINNLFLFPPLHIFVPVRHALKIKKKPTKNKDTVLILRLTCCNHSSYRERVELMAEKLIIHNSSVSPIVNEDPEEFIKQREQVY